jgi:hypothetical protein
MCGDKRCVATNRTAQTPIARTGFTCLLSYRLPMAKSNGTETCRPVKCLGKIQLPKPKGRIGAPACARPFELVITSSSLEQPS